METTPGKDINEEGKGKYNSCDEIQHETESNRIYKCKFCRYQSKLKHSVTVHENSVHMKKKFPCDLCRYKATTKSNLTAHKQSKHEGIKYYCS